jgi:hypothetical protein
MLTSVADTTGETVMAEETTETAAPPAFDTDRAYRITADLRWRLDQHAILLTYTDNPVFRQLIGISRQWWTEWNASGLHDIARDTECDALELAFTDRLAVLEAALVAVGGKDAFWEFVNWARHELPEYSEPMVWDEEEEEAG